jgi:tetratricopeptide (TPR) repeat protein
MLGVLAAEDTIASLQTGPIGTEGQWLVRRDVKPRDLIVSRIAFNWQTQSASSWAPANADLSGVLREVLKSMDVWSRGPQSRGYLAYLRDFLEQGGLQVSLLDENGVPLSSQGSSLDDQSLNELGDAWIVRPDDVETWEAFVGRVIRHAAERDYESVIRVCQALLAQAKEEPDRARLLWILGWTYQESGDMRHAARTLAQATDSDPSLAQAWRSRGLAHLAAGDVEAALVALERALALDPEDERSYEIVLEIHRRADDAEAERAVLARRADAMPYSLLARYDLATALGRAGEQAQADQIMRRLRSSSPEYGAPFADWAVWTRLQVEGRRGKRVHRRLQRAWLRDSEWHWWAPWLEAAAFEAVGDPDGVTRMVRRMSETAKDWQEIREEAVSILGDLLPADSALLGWLQPVE